MIAFPGCKINLGLNITHRLPNGYHAIESIFVPVPLSDILEIIAIPKSKSPQFNYSGISIPGDPSNNIVKKAYDLLNSIYKLPSIKVHLHKIVPMGAGLGGGSADASAMLQLLNKLFSLNIAEPELLSLAGDLGADCPFFIENKIAFVSGTGEKSEPINPGLSGKKILLIYPNIHIDTSKAFKNIEPKKPNENLKYIINHHPISDWKYHIKNDFEPSVFIDYPELVQIKKELYKMGADYTSLSGSGSTLYGVFTGKIPKLPEVFEGYFTFSGQL